jgi:isocitrate dehydrogenase (NAD+)
LLFAACLMLDYVGETQRAQRIRSAAESLIREQTTVTRDLGGTASTAQFADAVIARMNA